jgi:hypothetical protein
MGSSHKRCAQQRADGGGQWGARLAVEDRHRGAGDRRDVGAAPSGLTATEMAPSSAVPGKQKPIVLKQPAAPGFWTSSPVAAAASAVTAPLSKHAANTAFRTRALTT